MSTPHLDSDNTLSCHYSQQPLQQLLQRDDLLVAVNYNSPCLPTTNPKHYNCGLNSLSAQPVTEIWTSSAAINHGSLDNCHWSQTDEVMMLCVVVDETTFANQQQAVDNVYRRLLQTANERGYPHLIRIWNYMPDINSGSGDDERYRHFCVGRQQAFSHHHYLQGQYPSACALGHQQGQTIIYLLAARRPGQHFENPNQQSAYQYPRQYGPQSPSFSRATLIDLGNTRQLFISGTASIVGHCSVVGTEHSHSDDLARQIATTLSNIEKLLLHVAQQAALPSTPQPSSLKIYLRHATDYPAIKTAIEQHILPGTELLYVQADICRQELLLEIDGLCELLP